MTWPLDVAVSNTFGVIEAKAASNQTLTEALHQILSSMLGARVHLLKPRIDLTHVFSLGATEVSAPFCLLPSDFAYDQEPLADTIVAKYKAWLEAGGIRRDDLHTQVRDARLSVGIRIADPANPARMMLEIGSVRLAVSGRGL